MSNLLCTVAPKRNVLLDVAAVAVSMDEPCMGLVEVNLTSPIVKGNSSVHRYRCVYVMRDEQIATFMQDLGPVGNFPGVIQIRLPGGVLDPVTERIEVVETVGRLCDIADRLQAGMCAPPEYPASPDLLQDALLQYEEIKRCERRASSFSKAHKIQRS